MAVCVIFLDGVAMEGLVLLLPRSHLHATAMVILSLYHEDMASFKLKLVSLQSVFC